MQHFKANRGRLRRQELEIEVSGMFCMSSDTRITSFRD